MMNIRNWHIISAECAGAEDSITAAHKGCLKAIMSKLGTRVKIESVTTTVLHLYNRVIVTMIGSIDHEPVPFTFGEFP